jgi:hypothetical protein
METSLISANKCSAAFENLNNKCLKYKIVGGNFEENSEEVMLKIKILNSNQFLMLKASQIAINKEILSQLIPEDAYLVGFILASEIAGKERSLMLKTKTNPTT